MEESMSTTGRPRKTSGAVFRRPDSAFWWVRYRDRDGQIVGIGRDDRRKKRSAFLRALWMPETKEIAVVLAGKNLTFSQLADWFLERRSRPPFQSRQNTHASEPECPEAGSTRLWGAVAFGYLPEAIEDYLRVRLSAKGDPHQSLDLGSAGLLNRQPSTRNFGFLRRMLSVAIKQKMAGGQPLHVG